MGDVFHGLDDVGVRADDKGDSVDVQPAGEVALGVVGRGVVFVAPV